MFISFEGCDGSGKSTQARMLAENLRLAGHEVVQTREPGGTELAEKVRQLLLSENGVQDPLTEFLLLSAARRDHVKNLIMPALMAGKIVISDRFFDSSFAYQGYGKGLDQDIMWQVNNLAIDDFKPDITFFLDIDFKTSVQRANARNEQSNHYDQASDEFHQKIWQGFKAIACSNGERIVSVNGERESNIIAQEILSIATARL